MTSSNEKSTYMVIEIASNKKKVIKTISYKKYQSEMIDEAIRVINTISSLKNKESLALYDKVIQDKESVYLVRPMYENVFDTMNSSIIKRYFEDIGCFDFLMCIISALKPLHSLNYYHGGIKFSNIFRKDDYSGFYLGDYLINKLVDNKLILTLETVKYMTPEQLENKELCLFTDIWQIGVIMYVCITGIFPFDGNSTTEIVNKIIKGNFKLFDDEFKEEFNNFFLKIFVNDGYERFKIDELEIEIKELNKPVLPVIPIEDFDYKYEFGLECYKKGVEYNKKEKYEKGLISYKDGKYDDVYKLYHYFSYRQLDYSKWH